MHERFSNADGVPLGAYIKIASYSIHVQIVELLYEMGGQFTK